MVNLLADTGYANYSDIVLVQSKMVRDKPEVVRAFVEASIEGWRDYMEDPAAGQRADPERQPRHDAGRARCAR